MEYFGECCVNTMIRYYQLVGWLVGFYGTAAKYRLYSAGECSECENECACQVGGVVPPCTLEQWVNSPPPIPLGVANCVVLKKLEYTVLAFFYITSPMVPRVYCLLTETDA